MPHLDPKMNKEYKRIYYLQNREVILERAKKWNKAHKDRYNARRRR